MSKHIDASGQDFDCPVRFNNTVDFSNSTGMTLPSTLVGSLEYLTLPLADLRAATGATYGIPSPVAGTITLIQHRLSAALATGDAVVTGKIGAVAITGGVLTVTQAASAAGDVDTATPSAANVVAVGSDINFTISGANTANVGGTLIVTIRRSA